MPRRARVRRRRADRAPGRRPGPVRVQGGPLPPEGAVSRRRRSKAGERRVMCDHLRPGCFPPRSVRLSMWHDQRCEWGGSSDLDPPRCRLSSCGLQHPLTCQGPVRARRRARARRSPCADRTAAATAVDAGRRRGVARMRLERSREPERRLQRPRRLAGDLNRQAAASARAAGDRLPAVLRGLGAVARQGRRRQPCSDWFTEPPPPGL